jgi:hypothetical protein
VQWPVFRLVQYKRRGSEDPPLQLVADTLLPPALELGNDLRPAGDGEHPADQSNFMTALAIARKYSLNSSVEAKPSVI